MCQSSHRNRGFTLIELVIVVAVVAILAAVGYPSYTEYVQRSRIAEATSTLSDWRIRMERYYQDNRTYLNGDDCGVTEAGDPQGSFAYECANVESETYILRAEGRDDRGMSGFVYTVNESNQRTTEEFPGVSDPQNCWITRRGDAC